MHEIFFGIASYRRPDNQRTLDYIERIGIDREHIIMSVQSAEDKAQYEKAGIGSRVGRLIYRPGKNVSDNRNTLLESVPPGTRLVMLDDDINAVCKLDGKASRKTDSRDEFYSMLKRGYALAARHRTGDSGLYPVKHAYFMSTGYMARNVVIGTLFAIANTDSRFDKEMAIKAE